MKSQRGLPSHVSTTTVGEGRGEQTGEIEEEVSGAGVARPRHRATEPQSWQDWPIGLDRGSEGERAAGDATKFSKTYPAILSVDNVPLYRLLFSRPKSPNVLD